MEKQCVLVFDIELEPLYLQGVSVPGDQLTFDQNRAVHFGTKNEANDFLHQNNLEGHFHIEEVDDQPLGSLF